MVDYRDAFEFLGLPVSAPPEQIRSQYRQLALRFHPDKVRQADGNDSTEKRFHYLNESYQEAIRYAEALISEAEQKQQEWYQQSKTTIDNQVFMGHPEGGVFVFVQSRKPDLTNVWIFPKMSFPRANSVEVSKTEKRGNDSNEPSNSTRNVTEWLTKWVRRCYLILASKG